MRAALKGKNRKVEMQAELQMSLSDVIFTLYVIQIQIQITITKFQTQMIKYKQR